VTFLQAPSLPRLLNRFYIGKRSSAVFTVCANAKLIFLNSAVHGHSVDRSPRVNASAVRAGLRGAWRAGQTGLLAAACFTLWESTSMSQSRCSVAVWWASTTDSADRPSAVVDSRVPSDRLPRTYFAVAFPLVEVRQISALISTFVHH